MKFLVVLGALLCVCVKACSVDLPLDAVFVVRHKSNANTFNQQRRWLLESARYLGIGVLNRDTQIGIVSDEGGGRELTCITTDIDVLDWQMGQQTTTTSNAGATAAAIHMAGALLPSEARGTSDQESPASVFPS